MSKKVLIVDDAVFMRMKLKDILEKNGYEVVGEAQNGQEALEKIPSNDTRLSDYGYHDARSGWLRGIKNDPHV